jgi:hypothetical protein
VSFWCFASSLGTWSCFLVARMYWYGVWDATSNQAMVGVRVLSISLLLPIQLLGRDYYFSNVLLLASSGSCPSYFVCLERQDRSVLSLSFHLLAVRRVAFFPDEHSRVWNSLPAWRISPSPLKPAKHPTRVL